MAGGLTHPRNAAGAIARPVRALINARTMNPTALTNQHMLQPRVLMLKSGHFRRASRSKQGSMLLPPTLGDKQCWVACRGFASRGFASRSEDAVTRNVANSGCAQSGGVNDEGRDGAEQGSGDSCQVKRKSKSSSKESPDKSQPPDAAPHLAHARSNHSFGQSQTNEPSISQGKAKRGSRSSEKGVQDSSVSHDFEIDEEVEVMGGKNKGVDWVVVGATECFVTLQKKNSEERVRAKPHNITSTKTRRKGAGTPASSAEEDSSMLPERAGAMQGRCRLVLMCQYTATLVNCCFSMLLYISALICGGQQHATRDGQCSAESERKSRKSRKSGDSRGGVWVASR